MVVNMGVGPKAVHWSAGRAIAAQVAPSLVELAPSVLTFEGGGSTGCTVGTCTKWDLSCHLELAK